MKKILLISVVVVSIITLALLQKLGILNNISDKTPPTTNSLTNNSDSSDSQTTDKQTKYRDGAYTGDVTDAIFGPYQVRAIIKNGKISDIEFLQYPNDVENSRKVSAFANPALKQEAIASQNAKVDIVSGATQTSDAFILSLQSALDQAI